MHLQFAGLQQGQLKQKAIEELWSIVAMINAKAPEDAAGFKAWLQVVAQRTAEAGNKGGFLGFGGKAVSDAERATLAEIAIALGTTAQTSGANAVTS